MKDTGHAHFLKTASIKKEHLVNFELNSNFRVTAFTLLFVSSWRKTNMGNRVVYKKIQDPCHYYKKFDESLFSCKGNAKDEKLVNFISYFVW